MDPINEKYYDLWKLKDEQHVHVDNDKPVVIYMDGAKVTNNHKLYNMTEEYSLPYHLYHAGMHLIQAMHLDCKLYAGTDEINFIFPNLKQLISAFSVGDNAGYICSLFLQRFNRRIWTIYPYISFKTVIFNIEKADVERYICYRKDITYSAAIYYYMKEFFEPKIYKNKTLSDLETIIKSENLWDSFQKSFWLKGGFEGTFSSNTNIHFQPSYETKLVPAINSYLCIKCPNIREVIEKNIYNEQTVFILSPNEKYSSMVKEYHGLQFLISPESVTDSNTIISSNCFHSVIFLQLPSSYTEEDIWVSLGFIISWKVGRKTSVFTIIDNITPSSKYFMSLWKMGAYFILNSKEEMTYCKTIINEESEISGSKQS